MRCHNMHATIRVAACLANQKRKIGVMPGAPGSFPRYPGCRGCAQGELARRGLLDDADVEDLVARREGAEAPEGDMMDAVEAITDVTANETVESGLKRCIGPCARVLPVDQFAKNNKSHDGRLHLCRECWLDRLAQGWRRRRESLTTQPRPAAVRSPHVPGGVVGDGPATEQDSPAATTDGLRVTIDFAHYPEVWEWLSAVASDQERTVDGQVRFWMREKFRESRA